VGEIRGRRWASHPQGLSGQVRKARNGHPREGGDPVSSNRFAAFGLHGQAIFIDPSRKLVVVHTAVWAEGDDRAERGAQFRFFEDVLKVL